MNKRYRARNRKHAESIAKKLVDNPKYTKYTVVNVGENARELRIG